MGHTEEPNSILGKLFFLLKLPSEDFQQTVKLRASTSPWESRLWTFRFRQRERENMLRCISGVPFQCQVRRRQIRL